MLQELRSCPRHAVLVLALLLFAQMAAASDDSPWAEQPVTERPTGDSISPFYYNDEDLTSIQAVGLAAAFLSACAGHANTVAFALRPMTTLAMCKPPRQDPQYILQIPVVAAIGDDPLTQYYAGNALFNLPLLALLAVFAAVLAVLLSLSTDFTFWQALRKARFPGNLTAPYFYLSYQTTAGVVTLLSTSSSDSSMVLWGVVSLVLWAVLLVPVVWMLFYQIPKYATFVPNFAEVSHHKRRQKRRRLIDHVTDYVAKLQEEERRQSAAEAADAVGVEDGNGDGSSPHHIEPAVSESNTAGIQSILSNVVSRLKQWSNRSGTGDEEMGEAAPEDAAKRRLFVRRQNATYSMMLAQQLLALDVKYRELTDLLAGPDRWEDTLPDVDDVPLGIAGDAQSEATSYNSLQFLGKASGFVQSTGIVFESYKLPWFVLLEASMCFVCGVAQGYRPSDDQAIGCLLPALLMTCANFVYMVLLLLFDVHVSWFEGGLVKAIAGMQLVASAVALISLTSPGETMELASYLLALLSMYVVILKGLLHTYEILAWWMSVPGTAWGAVEEYGGHYKDMDRSNSVSKIVVKRKLIARPIRNDDASSIHSGADDDGADKVEFALEEVPVFVNEEDESHFASVGGRSNAFVTSRGVPLSLLPFRLAPLPAYAPLPTRTRSVEDGLRMHKKKTMLDARKKKLWEQVKHLFTDEEVRHGYEDRELQQLQELAAMNRRLQDSEGNGPSRGDGDNGAKLTADDLLDDVRERIEQEYRRNEEIEERRRAVLKGKVGDEHWRLQEALDKGDFYNDEGVSFKRALFDSGNVFSPPSGSLLSNRSMCFGGGDHQKGSDRKAKRSPRNTTSSKDAGGGSNSNKPPVIDLTTSMQFNAINNTSIFDFAILAEMRKSRGVGGGAAIDAFLASNGSMANPSIFFGPGGLLGSVSSGTATPSLHPNNNSIALSQGTAATRGGTSFGNNPLVDPLSLEGEEDALLVSPASPSAASLRPLIQPMSTLALTKEHLDASLPLHMSPDHRSTVGSEVLTRLADIKRASAMKRQGGSDSTPLAMGPPVVGTPNAPGSRVPPSSPLAIHYTNPAAGGGTSSALHGPALAVNTTGHTGDSLLVAAPPTPLLAEQVYEYDIL